ncbi:MAG: transporter substrate-binding domain-containing protein, partial [Ruminococcus sp.]
MKKTWMKRMIAISAAAAMALPMAACGSKNGDSKSGEKQKFIVGFDAAFPPYGYQDENGEYVGFDLDLAAEVCNRNDWELVKQPIDWDTKDM